MKRLIFVCALCVLCGGAKLPKPKFPDKPVANKPVVTLSAYGQARKRALETGHPLVVFITATWCGPCQKLKSDWPLLRQSGVLNGTELVWLDVDRSPKMAAKLTQQPRDATTVPQVIVYRKVSGRWPKWQHRGYGGAEELSAWFRGVWIWKPKQGGKVR